MFDGHWWMGEVRSILEEHRPDLIDELETLWPKPISEAGAFLNKHFPDAGGWSGRDAMAVPRLLREHLGREGNGG